jgi:hypothetical protein
MTPLWTMTVYALLGGQLSSIGRMELFTKYPILGRPDFPDILDTAARRLGGGDPNEGRMLQTMAEWLRTEQSIADKLVYDFPADHSLDNAEHVEIMLGRLTTEVRGLNRGSLARLVAQYGDFLLFARAALNKSNKLF